MKGDFTRFTFDPKRHYNSVLMQQGRVILDADWNEQADIQEHIRETQVVDVVGRSGAPIDSAGFKVEVAPGGQDLILSSGRMYVDGILCELDEDLRYFRTDQPEIGVEAPQTYLAYLDVWNRHITSVEDENIREKALDGLDTTTRTKKQWRLKLVPCELENKSCREASLKLKSLTYQRDSSLAVRLQPIQKEFAKDPCAALSGTAYRGLENQLYRVEIHRPGEVGEATFKWSRNNGAIAFAIVEFIEDDSVSEESANAKTENEPKLYHKVTLQQLGWDQELRIHKGDWVEVLGDETELLGEPGTLARVEDIDEADMILTLTADVAKHLEESNPKIHRWDLSESKLEESQFENGIPITANTGSEECEWIELENGIEVCFKTGDNYRTGDYWMIAARNTGEIEWPHDENDFVPKFGIQYHNCLLAILTRNQDGTWNLEKDCRKLFPPLADMVFLSYVGGDGQEAMPGYELPAPFRVKVSRGEHPVEGAEIAFGILEGQGVLNPAGSVLTGKDGIAQCTCQFNSRLESLYLRVRAELIDVVCPDENGAPSHPAIIFNANASVAEEVAYAAPIACLQLKDAKTVKDAIDGLCRQVSFSYVGGDGQEAMPGYELSGPLRVRVSRGSYPVNGAKVNFTIDNIENGKLSRISGGTIERELDVFTDENGIASCFCRPHKNATIIAKLLEPSPPDQSSILFCANISVAEEVAYAAPIACLQLKDAKTVKDAIDGLCRQVSFSYVGGDGQETMPGYELSGPLRVRVSRGSYPVNGAKVNFTIDNIENGKLSLISGGTGERELDVFTDENGIASCFCRPHKNATIIAKLLEPSPPDQSSILFCANVSVAEEVAYAAPIACPQLRDVKTVKDAIDGLCKTISEKTSRIVWIHGNSLQVEKLAGEISVLRENYATTVKLTNGSKARMHFSIPTIQFISRDLPMAQKALIRLKASSVSLAASVYDGERLISDGTRIDISETWETKDIVLSGNQISTGLGISILAECTERSGQIELSAAGCILLSNW